MSTTKYYPALSEIVTMDDLPDTLNFIKDGIKEIFDKFITKIFNILKASKEIRLSTA